MLPETFAFVTFRSVPQVYEESLISEGVLPAEDAALFRDDFYHHLDDRLSATASYTPSPPEMKGGWKAMTFTDRPLITPDTGVAQDVLLDVGKSSVTVPEGFVRSVHRPIDDNGPNIILTMISVLEYPSSYCKDSYSASAPVARNRQRDRFCHSRSVGLWIADAGRFRH
jgi:hypothetical protein